ncbi:hypothetical protein D9756_003790 [Leucocoprinus leucothites]|uniref:Uncharacterized protein n=1 Tax=Leucocoprinus leucothites TaxID=201217 RepID=A0A8H5D9P4_9AGAR|nr:hypothetical protein D9756_003790 [Leucoagaricus leucothites]
MDSEKLSYQINTTHDSQPDTSVGLPIPVVNVHITESSSKRKDKNIWSLLYVLGVFGCMYLLFHLYLSMAYHHLALNNGLRQLEEEMHAMVKLHGDSVNTSISNNADIPIATPAHHHGHHRHEFNHILPHERKHHWSSNKREKNRLVERQYVKRGGSVLTWFHPGTGACGGHNGDNDFIVAISHEIWNGGAHCGDTISISYQGKTAKATVVDECMGCDPGHIDLSPGLLHYLAGPGADMVSNANWIFGSLSPPKPKPTPTPTHTYKPTTKPKPTTTSTSSNSSSSSPSSSSSSTSSTASSTSPSSYATPVSYGDDGQVHNIEDFETLLISLGKLVVMGASA